MPDRTGTSTQHDLETAAAAYVEAGGADGLTLDQAANRWHRCTALTEAQRERITRAAILKLHEPEPEIATETETIHDHEIEVEYEQVNEVLAARHHGARTQAETAYAAYVLTRARTPAPRRPRARGAGRPAARGPAKRSRARSGDSGEDGESGEPPGGRTCACGCLADISHRAPQARYLDDRHAAADRQRRSRELERAARVARSDTRPKICRCGGEAAYAIDHRWVCLACAHPIPGVSSDVNGRVADPQVAAVLAEEARRGAHRPRLNRAWRTRPTRSLSARLRKTRKHYVDESAVAS